MLLLILPFWATLHEDGDYADIAGLEPPHIYEEIDARDHADMEVGSATGDHTYYELCPATVDIEVTDNDAYGVGQVV